MTRRAPPITLTTDFGTGDPFVGVMKGVLLGLAPDSPIVDITHEVPPQDISAGAYHLSNAWRHFPRGTVHVVVVDPGVGSSRRPLAVASEEHLFVGPDNGVLTPVLLGSSRRVVEITSRHYMASSPAPTFHGRDIFAPAAAHLARGTEIDHLGAPVADPVLLDLDEAEVAGPVIRARVVHVDRFGNLVLNVHGSHLSRAAAGRVPRLRAEVGGHRIEMLVTHYAAAAGAICFLVNSDGRLEIALPGGSAARELGIARGATLDLRVE